MGGIENKGFEREGSQKVIWVGMQREVVLLDSYGTFSKSNRFYQHALVSGGRGGGGNNNF